MSSLIANLHRGSAALIAQSKGLEVAGRNMGNVNTPGYTRQRVQLSAGETFTSRTGTEAMAVRIDGVTQARSIFMDRQVASERSLSSGTAVIKDIYDRTQSALGQNINTSGGATGVDATSASSGGIIGALSEFFNSIQGLAANPSDQTAKNTVVDQASALIDQVNFADQRLAALQSETTDQIASDVSDANQLIKDLASINEKIARSEVMTPGSALDLRDQRQTKIEALSAFMNIETRNDPGGNGRVEVFARDGGGAEVPLVDGAYAATVSFSGSTFQVGTDTLNLSSGSLVNQVEARDGFTQSVRTDLAAFATQLHDGVNAAYSATGQDFFAAGTGGDLIALAPGLTPATITATATGDAGANEVANALSDVANKKFSVSGGDAIDGTVGSFFSKTVSRIGTAVKSATSSHEDQQLTEQLALSRRDQLSGVSLDEEATDLMKYQRAFQASARFVNVVDDLLDTVINRMGRI